MKTLKNIIAIAIVMLVIVSCKNDKNAEIQTIEVETADTMAKAEIDQDATYAKAEFKIEGMTCAMGCAKTIEKKIANMDGVKSAIVDFDKELAMVVYDEAKVTTKSLEETVKKTSDTYSVKDMKTVDAFSAKKGCDEDCKKACCNGKTEAEKTACAKDCKKACCAVEKKA